METCKQSLYGVLGKKFLNKSDTAMALPVSGKQMLAGQAILSETATQCKAREYELEDIVRQHARLVIASSMASCVTITKPKMPRKRRLCDARYGKKLGKVEDQKAWLARIAGGSAVVGANSTHETGDSAARALTNPSKSSPLRRWAQRKRFWEAGWERGWKS